jgi:hypothetical protein
MSTELVGTGATWDPNRKDELLTFVQRLAADDDPLYDEVKANVEGALEGLGIQLFGQRTATADDLPPKAEIRELLAVLDPSPGIEPVPFASCMVIGLAMTAGSRRQTPTEG